ncbi:condensation domain-containing protein [Streptomyces sp. MS1.HAVA.3]|uniref:Condensation domain-containing protein n=1 Tax=Streptomyces caledonius TaxID=3134107 RepID=A0ABU8U5L0_9ACTN
MTDALEYWRTELAGLEPLELPTDRPRPSARTGALGHLTRTVPADTARGLDKAAAEYGTPLSAVLLAAYQVLLGRWTRQRDLAVGVPGTGGDLAVVRADLTAGASFAELVARTDAATTRGRAAALPVGRLAAAFAAGADADAHADVHADAGHHPVVQALFTAGAAYAADGVCPPDLTLALDLGREDGGERDAGLGLRVDFAAELFDEASADRFADGYLTLLTAIAAAPGLPLEGLDPLTDAERELLLTGWAAAAPRSPPTPTRTSPGWSPSRPGGRPTPSRSSSARRSSPTGSSTPAPTASPTTCAASAPGPTCPSESAWSAAPT